MCTHQDGFNCIKVFETRTKKAMSDSMPIWHSRRGSSHYSNPLTVCVFSALQRQILYQNIRSLNWSVNTRFELIKQTQVIRTSITSTCTCNFYQNIVCNIASAASIADVTDGINLLQFFTAQNVIHTSKHVAI